MNSVLQQLYMIPPIRDSVLKLDEAAQDLLKQQQQEEENKGTERQLNKTNKNEVGVGLDVALVVGRKIWL